MPAVGLVHDDIIPAVVDWGAGNYEETATEFEPVAGDVVQRAALSPGDDVVDLACGTGNAALLAAALGARVVGVDAAPRLLQVARERARAQAVELDLREGDLLALPIDDDAVDVVLSVFGVIFAPDPAQSLREIARVLRPGGRTLLSAWVPAGPIDAMLSTMRRIVGRITQAPPVARVPWFDAAAIGPLAADAGLILHTTVPGELAIRGASPDAYVTAAQEHPMAVAVRPVLKQAGATSEVLAEMLAVLREANEDPSGFLIHSPYVVHELSTRPGVAR